MLSIRTDSYIRRAVPQEGGGVVKCGLSSLEKSQSCTIKQRDSSLTVFREAVDEGRELRRWLERDILEFERLLKANKDRTNLHYANSFFSECQVALNTTNSFTVQTVCFVRSTLWDHFGDHVALSL